MAGGTNDNDPGRFPTWLGWVLGIGFSALACWALWGILEPLLHHYLHPVTQP